jgi:hypothetical protein
VRPCIRVINIILPFPGGASASNIGKVKVGCTSCILFYPGVLTCILITPGVLQELSSLHSLPNSLAPPCHEADANCGRKLLCKLSQQKDTTCMLPFLQLKHLTIPKMEAVRGITPSQSLGVRKQGSLGQTTVTKSPGAYFLPSCNRNCRLCGPIR